MASGIQPEVQVLLISEDDGQAQMPLMNHEADPLLLYTRIYDVGDSPDVQLIPLPPITRVEAHGRQIVRFVLENSGGPLAVQHYKRVSFEGIPPQKVDPKASIVRVNVRYDLPVVISPRSLPKEESPWTRLTWTLDGRTLAARNPGPYVVRMSPEVDLLPLLRRVKLMQRTFLLPGEVARVDLPEGVAAETVTGVRLFPTALYGAAAPDFDVSLVR